MLVDAGSSGALAATDDPLAASGTTRPAKPKRKSGGAVKLAKGSAIRFAKIIGGAALTAGSCWLIYASFQDGGRFRVKMIWLPIAGLGIMASGFFGSGNEDQ